uniref:Uncharacterized protein n=1 Tax=Ananas comosus var. bracteatus TaxID=296719 RepID=A0A6V7P3T5_ANACO|nr:unnamed protein product [Ananas comosus var. bracteatus]
MINLAESSNSGGSESSRRWVRQGLDLNAGPGSTDVEGKDSRLAAPLRQIPVATSQAFVEEQGRIYQMSGGGMKRKEPEGVGMQQRDPATSNSHGSDGHLRVQATVTLSYARRKPMYAGVCPKANVGIPRRK